MENCTNSLTRQSKQLIEPKYMCNFSLLCSEFIKELWTSISDFHNTNIPPF
jgi:hypothetical protein